jgi:hypothetical protein
MAKRYAVKVSGKFEESFFLMGSQVLLLLFFVVFLSSFATLPLSLSRRERVRQEEKNAKEYATVKIKRDERRKRKKERTKEESLEERRASKCERRNKRKSAEKLRCLPFFSSEIHRLKATTLAKGARASNSSRASFSLSGFLSRYAACTNHGSWTIRENALGCWLAGFLEAFASFLSRRFDAISIFSLFSLSLLALPPAR